MTKASVLFLIYANVGLIAITFLAIPMYTSSLGTAEVVRCDACHIIESEEFSKTAIHRSLKCISCHNISDFEPDLYTHNATTFECIYCHAGQVHQLNNDVHRNISNSINTSATFTGNNKMCVACHSRIELEIERHSYDGIRMTVSSVNGKYAVESLPVGENTSVNYVKK